MYSNINLVRRPVSQLLLVNPLTFDMHNVIIIYQMLDEDTRSVQYILNFILHYTVHCIIVGTLLYTDIHSVNQIVSHLLYSYTLFRQIQVLYRPS